MSNGLRVCGWVGTGAPVTLGAVLAEAHPAAGPGRGRGGEELLSPTLGLLGKQLKTDVFVAVQV